MEGLDYKRWDTMKSYVTFRRHPFDAVVARTNEDRHPLEVVPYGRFGAGLWTGHPIGLFIVTGLVVIGLVGITGRTTAPHLHYEVRMNDHAVNPRTYLPKG